MYVGLYLAGICLFYKNMDALFSVKGMIHINVYDKGDKEIICDKENKDHTMN
jgi:hypothetical protein